MEIENYLSEIDTNRFGFKIAKIDRFDISPKEVLEFLKNNNIKLVLTKVSAENIELINNLERLNFVIKDIQVTFKYDFADELPILNFSDSNILVRDIKFSDIGELEKIAAEAFLNYGHYAADKRLDVRKCNEIYSDWIRRSYEDSVVADKIIIAEYDGEIAGFLSFKIFKNNGYKYAAGGLGAVSLKFRNKNIFRKLVFEGLMWGRDNNFDWEEHNVLITNYPVVKSFTKLGFTVYKTFTTMHNWLD